MRTKAFRLAPAATLVIAGLLVGGPVAAASAAPQHSSAAVSAPQLAHAGKHGPYSSSSSCQKAGEKGKKQGKWHKYSCKKEHGKWYLYTS
ncbi:hypothetical protein LG634_23365 [Streptomyces bambusae]|uniref:hypothetical protein n=1 Tax=Streptomyces bambusae TaxID=1550616 RepID=UPI001CFD0782|nr:hypothetical protein [Streptomyces bambusae]MCB5167758.1 hypothetical protein [Streptomyces bambusae]